MNAASNLIDITAGNLSDTILLAYLEYGSATYNEAAGKAYGEDNWADLSDHAKTLYEHVFGPMCARRPGAGAAAFYKESEGTDYEQAILAAQEAAVAY